MDASIKIITKMYCKLALNIIKLLMLLQTSIFINEFSMVQSVSKKKGCDKTLLSCSVMSEFHWRLH